MSVSVKIPTTANPWKCRLNGVEYSYPAGSTQTVPDGVAKIIASMGTFPPEAAEPVNPWAIPMASTTAPGLVAMGTAVADAAGAAPTAAEFKALLDSLRNAGVIDNAPDES